MCSKNLRKYVIASLAFWPIIFSLFSFANLMTEVWCINFIAINKKGLLETALSSSRGYPYALIKILGVEPLSWSLKHSLTNSFDLSCPDVFSGVYCLNIKKSEHPLPRDKTEVRICCCYSENEPLYDLDTEIPLIKFYMIKRILH